MMANISTLTRRFERVFNRNQAAVLAESITEAYSDLVKTGDFNELKSIVQDLAVAQQRTEARVEELAASQQELAASQQELAASQQELVASQQGLAASQQGLAASQQELVASQQEMAANISKMAQTISGMGNELGGLSRTMSYALENEAYRALPAYLQEHFDVMVKSRFVRTEIKGEEIDFFAQGEQDGRPVCIIGESKLRIDERRRSGQEFDWIMSQLDRKAAVVQQEQPDCDIVRMLVTHYVRPSTRQMLEEEGVLVVQSFDW